MTFPMMHPMGQIHIALHMRHNDDMDAHVLREGEFFGNVLLGWNFGGGHCNDERLVEAVQQRCNYEPGGLYAVFTESQPLFSKKARYREIDAAFDVVEKGRNHNDDTYIAQPWLPDSLVPHAITWTREGYVPAGDPNPGTGGRAPKSNTASNVDA